MGLGTGVRVGPGASVARARQAGRGENERAVGLSCWFAALGRAVGKGRGDVWAGATRFGLLLAHEMKRAAVLGWVSLFLF